MSEERLDTLEKAIVDIRGEDGDGGTVGELRRGHRSLSSKAWWALTVFVSFLLGTLWKLVLIGQLSGELRADVASNRHAIQLLQADVQLLRSVLLIPRKDHLP